MIEAPNEYQVPVIVYEGDRERCAFHEVQAGSPVGLPVWDDLEEW